MYHMYHTAPGRDLLVLLVGREHHKGREGLGPDRDIGTGGIEVHTQVHLLACTALWCAGRRVVAAGMDDG